ncbi:MAG: hypothetical protein ACM3RX_00920 [Methanococcaceae archaeon]
MKGKLTGRLIKPKEAINRFVEIAIAYYKEETISGDNEKFYFGMYTGAEEILRISGILKKEEIDQLEASAKSEGIKLGLKKP